MNRLTIISTSLVVQTLIVVSVSHAATDEYSANLKTFEMFFGDGKRTTKLYAGKTQPDTGLAQILVLPGLSITGIDGNSVKSKEGWFGYSAYKQLSGTYEFEVTSWKRRRKGHRINWHRWDRQRDKHAAYVLQVVLEAGQKYVLSPTWNDGEVRIISPSQVCLQGQSDDARVCVLRPHESDEVFAMDEKHGVIIVGLTKLFWGKIIMINLDCDWGGNVSLLNPFSPTIVYLRNHEDSVLSAG